jgi:hypothetical protein
MTPFAQRFLQHMLESRFAAPNTDQEKLSLANRISGGMTACAITGDHESILDLAAASSIALVMGYDGLANHVKENAS